MSIEKQSAVGESIVEPSKIDESSTINNTDLKYQMRKKKVTK